MPRANGDNHGFSYHSDWLNGWPKGMLVDAHSQCNLNGAPEGCSIFEASRDVDKAYACTSTGEVINEV